MGSGRFRSAARSSSVCAELFDPGGVADQDRCDHRPASELGQQLGTVDLDELAKLCFELIDLTVEAAELGDLLVRDPDPGAGRQLPQPPVDAVQFARLVERAALQGPFKLGAQREQMPPQPVHCAGPFGDEIVAVIAKQPDLHRLLIQVRDRELLNTVLDDRARDRERIDLIRLARLALCFAGRSHAVRRHPHDPLAGGEQRLLEPA